jgi:hypothetical protein
MSPESYCFQRTEALPEIIVFGADFGAPETGGLSKGF